VKDLDFRIAADAANFLREHLLRSDSGEQLVLTIAPMSTHKDSSQLPDDNADKSYRELAESGAKYLRSLASPLPFNWVIGGAQRRRLSGEELLLIDGIECFFADEVKAIVSGRILRLRNGELVFDPALEPPLSRSFSPTSK
jgi:hypothetical protein